MSRRLDVRAVVHSAAALDLGRPYAALRAANVGATAALVDLVSRAGRPPPLFLFVSTLSVIPVASAAAAAGWRAESGEELVPPACAAALETGYAQSKLPAARVDMPVTRVHDMSETCPVGGGAAAHLDHVRDTTMTCPRHVP